MLVSRRFDGQPQEFFDLTEGTLQQAWEGLNRGQVVVGSVLALRRKLAAGQSLSIQTQQGPVDLEIAAIANDYLGGGLTVYMDSRLAKELLGVEGIDSLIVDAAPGQLAAVEISLQRLCESSGLILQSYSQLVKLIDGMVDSVVASLWMLLALGCAIAAMGLVNTLTMNILEQTREIGVLRVVAMTRSQVRSMMVAQAIMLGLLGLVPGALFGVFVQYSVGLSSYVVLGHEVAFILRPALFFGALLVGLLLVIAASWIPAERAARLKLAAALHYE
jgi:putative ABC transport system permease protein